MAVLGSGAVGESTAECWMEGGGGAQELENGEMAFANCVEERR